MTIAPWMASRTTLSLGAALACSAAAAAQQPTDPARLPDIFRMPDSVAPEATAPAPDSIEGLVAALDAEGFDARETASDALRERAAELLHAIEVGRINAADLSPEQRNRVADVLEGHFYETPRAGLGVQFQPMDPAGNGVALQMVLGEFPASRVLIAGDSIITADGVPLGEMPNSRAMEILRAMIISRNPGDTLPMTVQRGGVRVELDVELGDFRNLNNGGGAPAEVDLLRAWQLRAESLGLASRWDGRIETAVARRDWPAQRRLHRLDPGAAIFAGGTSQSSNIQLLALGLPLRQREPVEAIQELPGRINNQPERTIDERREQLIAQIDQLQLRAQVTEQRANDLNAGEAQRREAAVLLVQIRARIAELRDELERLERR